MQQNQKELNLYSQYDKNQVRSLNHATQTFKFAKKNYFIRSECEMIDIKGHYNQQEKIFSNKIVD